MASESRHATGAQRSFRAKFPPSWQLALLAQSLCPLCAAGMGIPPRRGQPGRMRKKLILLGVLDPYNFQIVTDEKGRKRRKGGYHPVCRSKPVDWQRQVGSSKVSKWRHEYKSSTWWRQLQDERTYEGSSYVGKQFRRDFRITRDLFDILVAEANTVAKLKEQGRRSRQRAWTQQSAREDEVARLFVQAGQGM